MLGRADYLGKRKKGLRSSGATQPPQERSEISHIMQEISRPARRVNMPRRVNLCRRALELVTHLQNAAPRAALLNELGNSLVQSPKGDRAENIEQAIECYYRALEIYTDKDYPKQWAMTENNLALAYSNRITGNQAENIEQAIHHYEQALKVRTENDYPKQWAETKNNLAAAYISRIWDDRAENIEQAIEHCRQALKVRTEKDFPADWAMTENNLANAYSNRIRGDRADNIEEAIHHYEQALKVYREKDFPADWAMTENNLANAYSDRIWGDREDNIEKAIDHYKQALNVYKKEDYPDQWAAIENNLAGAYNGRIRGERDKNIERAIHHYHQALKIYKEKDYPERWAMTNNNLGLAFSNYRQGDRTENIEQAIHHYEKALKVYTEEAFPEKWAGVENNLALAYRDRIQGDRENNIEQSIDHFQQALKIRNEKDYPNLCRKTAYNLGNLCLEVQRFSEAGKAYSMGIEAAGELYRASIFQASKEAELAETRDLYRRAGYALANSDKLQEAAVALERGRARGLGDALARDRADLERIREKDLRAYELYRQAVQELQSLESQERAGGSEGGTSAPRRDLMLEARNRLDEAVDAIRRIPGYEDFLKGQGWEDIAAAVVECQPLVYITAAPGGGVALVVHRSPGSADASVETVPLDGFSEERFQEHLKIWFDAYGGWQKALHDASLDYGQAEEKWFDAIDYVTGQLWQEVAEPIYASLQSLKPDQVFLIPTGLLALLPLHAAWRDKGGRREYLQDLLPISYIPSARALAYARRIAGSAAPEKLLAVDEPRLLKPSPLPSSGAEVSAISSHFYSPVILAHEKASRAAVLQALPKAQVAHFSCHGEANWNDPENSGLVMAKDEILTIKDLFELHLAGARLATLSACETGIPGTKLPDEVVSLPSAFIRAGFAGAIGSLWTVPDKSTALLMTSLYQLWREKGMLPSQALVEAQKELRAQEKFQHPFYWAAFYMTGV